MKTTYDHKPGIRFSSILFNIILIGLGVYLSTTIIGAIIGIPLIIFSAISIVEQLSNR